MPTKREVINILVNQSLPTLKKYCPEIDIYYQTYGVDRLVEKLEVHLLPHYKGESDIDGFIARCINEMRLLCGVFGRELPPIDEFRADLMTIIPLAVKICRVLLL